MGKFRSDLIIEAAELGAVRENQNGSMTGADADSNGVSIREVWNKDRSMKVTTVQIQTKEGEAQLGRPIGRYITLELPELLSEREDLKQLAGQELYEQLVLLLEGKPADSMLIVGLGNREVTADAVGPLTVDGLLVTRHLFQQKELVKRISDKYRKVSALVPGVMAQTGMETMELIRGVVEEIHPDVVLVIDALAAGSPKRLNTTIQLTDTGIRPGAGVGNNRRELNEETLGCPVIAIGVPTVLDASVIAKEDVEEEVEEFFVMPRNIDSAVQYVSELLAEGINKLNTLHRKNQEAV